MGHVMGGVQWVLLSGTTRAFNSDGKVGNGLPDSNAGTTSGSASGVNPRQVAVWELVVEGSLTPSSARLPALQATDHLQMDRPLGPTRQDSVQWRESYSPPSSLRYSIFGNLRNRMHIIIRTY